MKKILAIFLTLAMSLPLAAQFPPGGGGDSFAELKEQLDRVEAKVDLIQGDVRVIRANVTSAVIDLKERSSSIEQEVIEMKNFVRNTTANVDETVDEMDDFVREKVNKLSGIAVEVGEFFPTIQVAAIYGIVAFSGMLLGVSIIGICSCITRVKMLHILRLLKPRGVAPLSQV